MSDEGTPLVRSPERPELAFEPGRPLPIFARREGVEVVVISVASYRDLLAAQARATQETIGAAVRAAKAPPPGLSTIEKDPEVADFLRDLFRGRMTLAALHAACAERFGAARAPSPSRIQTFRARWRSY